jgi:hypothetical protein
MADSVVRNANKEDIPIMKKAGKSKTNDPRLMAQLAQVLGRDG